MGKKTGKLANIILNKNNILIAISKAKSSIDKKGYSSKKGEQIIKDYNKKVDLFNVEKTSKLISDVEERLKKILLENKRFLVHVVRVFKKIEGGGVKYRYLHIPDSLEDLISMIAILNVFIYDVTDPSNNDYPHNLKLSNISKSFPANFYGNLPEEEINMLFKPWDKQYRLFQTKYLDLLIENNKSHDKTNQIYLDFKNFFPSINPKNLISIILNKYYDNENNEEQRNEINYLLEKLLILNVKASESPGEKSKDFWKIEEYYNLKKNVSCFETINSLSIGLPQGLPQANFFSNVMMVEIERIISATIEGDSIYYVDDINIFSNSTDVSNLEDKVTEINAKLLEAFPNNEGGYPYEIEIHPFEQNKEGSKTLIIEIDKISEEQGALYGLMMGASTTNWKMFLSKELDDFSQIESKIYSFQKLVEEELANVKENLLKDIEVYERNSLLMYQTFLKRVSRYFKYRINKIKAYKTPSELRKEIINNFEEIKEIENLQDKIEYLEKSVLKETITYYLTECNYDKESIGFINEQLKTFAEDELLSKLELESLLTVTTFHYTNDYEEVLNIVNKKKVKNIKNEDFLPAIKRLYDKENLMQFILIDDDFSTFKATYYTFIVSSKYIKRIFANAIVSLYYDIPVNDEYVYVRKIQKPLLYLELRVLNFIRNSHSDINLLKFFIDYVEINNPFNINYSQVDYSLFEVLKTFNIQVRDYKLVDNLIITHHYVYSTWINGSILFKYYTLHDVSHSISIIKILSTISVYIQDYEIDYYERYILYLSAYLHDISMADMPKVGTYHFDDVYPDNIKKDLLKQCMNFLKKSNGKTYDNNCLKSTYSISSAFLDGLTNHVRKKHAQLSADLIKSKKDLDYLVPAERLIVSIVSRGHGMEPKEIEQFKENIISDSKVINIFKLISLLRIGDVLDVGHRRAYPVVYNNNIEFMSRISKFNWISHLATEDINLKTVYSYDDKIEEKVIFEYTFNLKIDEFVKKDLSEYSIKVDGFNIEIYEEDSSSKAPTNADIHFMVAWFMDKNSHLVEELQWLQKKFKELNELKTNSIFKTVFGIEIIFTDKEKVLPQSYLDLIKNEVYNKLKQIK